MVPFSIRKKTELGIRQKLLISILFIGYVALFSTHSLFQLFDSSNLQNTFFYSSHTNQGLNTDQYRPVTDQKSESVHVKINKHFETEKLLFIVPSIAGCPVFDTPKQHPILADPNYFISTFLLTTRWRGPPATA